MLQEGFKLATEAYEAGLRFLANPELFHFYFKKYRILRMSYIITSNSFQGCTLNVLT